MAVWVASFPVGKSQLDESLPHKKATLHLASLISQTQQIRSQGEHYCCRCCWIVHLNYCW